jgi:heme exporter protein B
MFWKAAWAVVWKDVLAEIRTREALISMLVFSLLVIVMFNFAFEPGTETVREMAPGILWVAFIFAGVLGLNKSFVGEKENDCIQGLLLSPADRSAIYLGKMISNVIFMGVVEAIALPAFAIFFNYNIAPVLPRLILVIILATVGFSSVGTLFSAMSVNTRAREVMLPVLMFPVVVPVLISAVKATGKILASRPVAEYASWMKILVAFDVIFIVASVLTFEYVLEE